MAMFLFYKAIFFAIITFSIWLYLTFSNNVTAPLEWYIKKNSLSLQTINGDVHPRLQFRLFSGRYNHIFLYYINCKTFIHLPIQFQLKIQLYQLFKIFLLIPHHIIAILTCRNHSNDSKCLIQHKTTTKYCHLNIEIF